MIVALASVEVVRITLTIAIIVGEAVTGSNINPTTLLGVMLQMVVGSFYA
jgi:hypothetical protein